MPGIDELVGLLEIVRLASSAAAYDVVVVDTAPTGHTLRLLAAPRRGRSRWPACSTRCSASTGLIREQLARVGRPEAADRLITQLGREARDTDELLLDRTRTWVHWVMLPEELAVAETMDAFRALDELGVSVREIVINRVTPPGPALHGLRSPAISGREGHRPSAGRNASLPPVRLLECRTEGAARDAPASGGSAASCMPLSRRRRA